MFIFTYVIFAEALQRRGGVGQECHEACTLDSLSKHALLACRGGKTLTAKDLAVGAHQLAEVLDILPVNINDFVAALGGD